MRIIILVILFVIFSSCKNESLLQDRVILSGKLSGTPVDSLKLVSDTRFGYYKQPKINKYIAVRDDGSFLDTLDIEEGHYELQSANEKVKLFLKPGYNLQLSSNNGRIHYDGDGAKENQYIQERDSLIGQVGGYNFYQYFSKLPEAKFLKLADSLEQQRLNLINTYPGMDARLQKTERLWAKVEKAHKYHNYSFTRVTEDTAYSPSKSYPEPFTHLDLNDPDLLDVSLFPILMYSEFGQTATEKNIEVWEYFLDDSFPVSNPIIKEEAFYTSAVFSMNRYNKLDEFYRISQEFLKDEQQKETIKEQYLLLKNLSAGQPAPAFSLKNMKDEIVSLKDMKGDLVYIDFWASWCRPCLDEIPAFKKLQELYKNESISFVSIGIESKKENLQRLIEKHDLAGIQLFDPAKEEVLKNAFAVSGLPHYVLIDKEGKMVEYKARKPSDPALLTQLDNLLTADPYQ